MVAYGGAGGVPIAVPISWCQAVSPKVKTLLVITSLKASHRACMSVLLGLTAGQRYWWMARSAEGVSMLVYIEIASAVNNLADGGSRSAMSCVLSSKELRKKERCARAMGCSFWSTQMPRGWRRLPLQETMGRVVHGVLCILMVPYKTGNGSSSLLSLSHCQKNCRSFFVSMLL